MIDEPILQNNESRASCIGRNVTSIGSMIAVTALLLGPGVATSVWMQNAIPFFGITAIELLFCAPGLPSIYGGLFSRIGGKKQYITEGQIPENQISGNPVCRI